MYVSITGVENNKDVYINQSYRKENGKSSSRIYRKLGKLNELLRQFHGDFDAMMAWAKSEAEKDTAQYNCSRSKFLSKLLKVFDKSFPEIFPCQHAKLEIFPES